MRAGELWEQGCARSGSHCLRLADATGGRVDPTPPQVFDPQGEKIEYHEALWPRVVMAAIIVFLLDLFLRRVRIFDRKVLPPARRAA